jgi:hypothetical protein
MHGGGQDVSGAATPSEGSTYEEQVDVTGEVLQADLRRGEFALWPDDGTRVTVEFPVEREGDVTAALRGHRMLRLRVIGRGEHSAQGELVRVTQVREMLLCPSVVPEVSTPGKSIEEKLAELAGNVPSDEWARLPADLSDQLDHYIYGTPKR